MLEYRARGDKLINLLCLLVKSGLGHCTELIIYIGTAGVPHAASQSQSLSVFDRTQFGLIYSNLWEYQPDVTRLVGSRLTARS